MTRRGLAAAAALVIAAAAPALAQPRIITDSAGRRVTVPARVERVVAAGGPAAILVYTLAPGKLLGWTRAMTPAERAYIPAPYADLPGLGRLTGRGNTANVEMVLAARPDVIVDYGSTGPTYASLAERVQQQTGVPYVLIDGSLSAIPAAYAMLGTLLGVPDRARELARYAERTLADVDRRVAQVPPVQRPAVYYARGPRGLETGLKGSINVEGLERLGARNVAAVGTGGLATVALEQVLAWNPEVVIAMDPVFHAAVGADPLWRGLRAVSTGRVHLVPQDPFPWLDFPPSVNRLIGLRWLGYVLYPSQFPEDLRGETSGFYQLFYHRAPDERQLDALLGGLARP